MFFTLPFENKNYTDLNPICIGREACASLHSFGPAVRTNYLIHYVVSGCGTLFAPKGEYKIRSGQLFLIKPGEINTYTADKVNPWDYIWIEFSGQAAKILENVENPVIDCDGAPFLRLYDLKKRSIFREEYAISELFLILTYFFDKNQPQDFVSKIKNYISANYMQEIKISKISKDFGYSRQHIARVFKADTGMTVQEYLIKTRLENSLKFLKDGFSIQETAYLCGYGDAFNFSRAFKAHFGKTPSNAKNSMYNYTLNE